MNATARTPSVDVRIRTLTALDLPRVFEIETQSFSTPWRESTFRGLLRRKDTDLLAASRGDQLIGYAIAWTVVDQAELGNIAIAPEARGLGVGGLLLRAMLERLRHRRAAECFLEVRESNEIAQQMYLAHGFAEVGRRRAYYNEPVEDALVMRIHLETCEE
jgi:[ribosomal protein S18]-alanine N-acetyltransferase